MSAPLRCFLLCVWVHLMCLREPSESAVTKLKHARACGNLTFRFAPHTQPCSLMLLTGWCMPDVHSSTA